MSITKAAYYIMDVSTRMIQKVNRPDEAFNYWADGSDGNSRYIWEDGNFSCDCNRESFFTGLAVESAPCGEGKFAVRVVAEDDGRILYDEWAKQEASA